MTDIKSVRDHAKTFEKALKASEKQAKSLKKYLATNGTLADKARLIQQGLWLLPEFDEWGNVTDNGDEQNYRPSQFNCKMCSDAKDFFVSSINYGDRIDPQNIEQCLSLWGEEWLAIAENYRFDGWEA